MDYTIKAIETKFHGINFRSRLEAKWAAMFDLLGWKWQYEPVDFNGWVPDFAIYGKRIVYVEVKPVVQFPEDVASKIDASGCSEEVLIVGQTCPTIGDTFCGPGWLRECAGDEWEKDIPMFYGGWSGTIFTKPPGCGFGFAHDTGSFQCRISGMWDGDHYLYDEPVVFESLWAEACNAVRWEKR